ARFDASCKSSLQVYVHARKTSLGSSQMDFQVLERYNGS
ncbi:hypothetical protein A2U01_0061712, partial [Trifolium medium]|nr:hypothetical protein [Trifolium medium]